MKGRKRVELLLACILFMIVLWPDTALANSTEPPGFVILVNEAPEDLTIVMTDGASLRSFGYIMASMHRYIIGWHIGSICKRWALLPGGSPSLPSGGPG